MTQVARHTADPFECATMDRLAAADRQRASPCVSSFGSELAQQSKGKAHLLGLGETAVEQTDQSRRLPSNVSRPHPGQLLESQYAEIRQAVDVKRCSHNEHIGIRQLFSSSMSGGWIARERRGRNDLNRRTFLFQFLP